MQYIEFETKKVMVVNHGVLHIHHMSKTQARGYQEQNQCSILLHLTET